MTLKRFCFEQLENGNLMGEYTINYTLEINEENAVFLSENHQTEEHLNNTFFNKKSTPPFLGKYRTSWLDGSEVTMNLRIFYKTSAGRKFIVLEWTNDDNEIIFLGEGFLSLGRLYGDCWDVSIVGQMSNYPTTRQIIDAR